MTTLRTTVIMKTDIRGSTVRFRTLPEVDLDALLTEHRHFVSRLAAAHDGRIVKPEGDGSYASASPPRLTPGVRPCPTEAKGH
jgi:class 3 adenylate cyclase